MKILFPPHQSCSFFMSISYLLFLFINLISHVSCFRVFNPPFSISEPECSTSKIPAGLNNPPSVTLRLKNDVTFDEKNDTFWYVDNDPVQISFICTAPYPVEIYYNASQPPWEEETRLFYTNFTDESTYTFYTKVALLFSSRHDGFNVSCVSRPFPWLRSIVQHTYDFDGESHKFSSISLSKSDENPCDVKNRTNLEDSNSNCPVLFYYEETNDTSGFVPVETYTFYCQEQNASGHGRWGNVTLQDCKTRGECENQAILIKEKYPDQYQNLFSKGKCWKKLEKGMKNCTDAECPPTKLKEFTTFIPKCSGFSNEKKDDIKFASFGFFQIPRHFQKRPKIVYSFSTTSVSLLRHLAFTEDKTKLNTRISMHRFNPRQLLNKVLQVKCSAASTFSIPAFQFALHFRGKNPNENPDHLEYLSVDNSTNFDEKFSLWHQTRQIDLDREDLIRIYCLVPVTTETEEGFKWSWNNASRRIAVQNPVDYIQPSSFSCPFSSSNSSLQPKKQTSNLPQLEISLDKFSYKLISTLSKINETESLYNPSSPGKLNVVVKCWANYPVQLVHNLQHFECPFGCSQYFRTFEDFENKSTYTFTAQGLFDLTSAYEESVLICQAAENPCLNQIVKYNRQNVSENQELPKFLLIKNAEENGGLYGVEEGSVGKGVIQSGPKFETYYDDDDDDDGDCPIIFDYRINPAFPHYEFWCHYENGSRGNVSLHPCQNPVDCLSLYGSKTQSKSCWKKNALYLLTSCGEECVGVKVPTYNPVFVTCVNEKTGEESNLGNFAFFGIVPDNTLPAKMYPSLEDLNSDVSKNQKTVILMEEFSQIQYINQELEISCKFSRFYLELQVVLVLEFSKKEGENSDLFYHDDDVDENEKKTSLKFWNMTDLSDSSQLTKWMKTKLYIYQFDRKIRFEEGQDFESLERIYCVAGKLGSFEWLNSSRPISVGTRQNPDVHIKLLKDGPPLETSSGKTGIPLHLTNETTDYSFDLHSKNKSIICDVFAYPPPNVTWTSTSSNSLSWRTVKKNSSHYRSILHFDEISPSHEGIYNCSASNGLDSTTVSKSVSIKVTPETSLVYLYFLIPTTALAIAVAVVIRLSYRIKQLVPKEEIDKFIQGDENPNEENPNSSIFRIPYDREKLEIDPSLVTLGELLGSGGFGEVYKGFVDRPESKESQIVGVKMVKANTELKHFLAFLSEIKIMSYLEHHENVLGLIGVSTENIEEMKVWAIVEFCDQKDLKHFLEGKRRQETFQCAFKAQLEAQAEPKVIPDGYKDMSTLITREPALPPDLFTLDLLRFCKGICNGMNYLTDKKVIHGDLAARNILLTSTSDENKWCVKISDFGLSRTLGRSNYIRTQEKYLPWLWMSPESLEHKKFSIESDIWSFGVVCWEIFSLAQQPEYGPNIILLNYVQQGGRLPCPEYANSKIYELMRDCWSWNETDRPSFALLHERFSQLIDDLIETSSMGNASTRTCLSSSSSSSTNSSSESSTWETNESQSYSNSRSSER